MRRTLAPRQPPRLVRTYIRTYVRTHTTTRLDSFLSRRERYLSSLAALLVIAPIIVVPTSHRRRCIDADANFPFAERFECVTHTHTHTLSLYTRESRRKKRRRKRKEKRKKNTRERERERNEGGRSARRSQGCVLRAIRSRETADPFRSVWSNVYRRNICSEKRREAYEHR